MSESTIPKVRFGMTDLYVTKLCQGTAFRTMPRSSNNDAGVAVLRYCLDIGINFFDSAIAYGWGGAEEALGKAISGRRDKAIICTKVPRFYEPSSDDAAGKDATFNQAYLETQLEGSLKRLGTDYVDLFLLHSTDGVTGPAEICSIMDSFVTSGKIRYWGVSNHPAEVVVEMQKTASAAGTSTPAGIEDYYTVAGVAVTDDSRSRTRELEREMFPCVREFGIGVLAFSPMDQGHLAPGREIEPDSPMERIIVELDRVAEELGVTRAEICVAWVIARPEVTSVLAGCESPEHVDQMLSGTSLEIPEECMRKLDEASNRFCREMETFNGST